jgi:hypothetical protein
MYTIADASRSTPPPVRSHHPLADLTRLRVVDALTCAFLRVGVGLAKFPSSVVTRPRCSIYRLLATMVQGESLSFVGVSYVINHITLNLYRVAF